MKREHDLERSRDCLDERGIARVRERLVWSSAQFQDLSDDDLREIISAAAQIIDPQQTRGTNQVARCAHCRERLDGETVIAPSR